MADQIQNPFHLLYDRKIAKTGVIPLKHIDAKVKLLITTGTAENPSF